MKRIRPNLAIGDGRGEALHERLHDRGCSYDAQLLEGDALTARTAHVAWSGREPLKSANPAIPIVKIDVRTDHRSDGLEMAFRSRAR
jgi:hypothetical protein